MIRSAVGLPLLLARHSRYRAVLAVRAHVRQASLRHHRLPAEKIVAISAAGYRANSRSNAHTPRRFELSLLAR